ncbi:MAG: hypothetical protein U0169_11055 [Polyangiaceae bacterium]
MPIVVRPVEGDALTQGDVLQGLPFATTASDGKLQADAKARFLLVISRPCKSLREPFVIVAPVHEWKLDLPQLRQQLEGSKKAADSEKVTLDRMRRFLAGVRDGGQQTDTFYLGDLEAGSEKRFAADLASLSTVHVPTDSIARAAWVTQHRIARLDIEFARDLHARVFNTVARLGFDDYGWFADPDLEIMITEGEKDLAQLKSALADAQSAVQRKAASGDAVPKPMSDEVQKRDAAVKTAEEQLAPYVAEREKRRAAK